MIVHIFFKWQEEFIEAIMEGVLKFCWFGLTSPHPTFPEYGGLWFTSKPLFLFEWNTWGSFIMISVNLVQAWNNWTHKIAWEYVRNTQEGDWICVNPWTVDDINLHHP